ncbi:helix-turn-helix domain-containing protein [Carnobacterium gallinarum]|uniref:helix-turn-helix domain-containing protein n=1 Tax=Carnobacterium gallinarum TaxID=2749 RepID=UPI0005507800|nr:helix-turn-helix domain-containing protein [Carnobacterium gallinarum]
MSMEMEGLLEEDARYKLYLLKIFEIKKNQIVSIDTLCELLMLSKFKVQKYIDTLNSEYVVKEASSDFIVNERGDLICYDSTKEQISQLRLQYLMESGIFKLFHELVDAPISIEKFSKKYFLSLSKGYALKKELSRFLKPWGLSLKKDRIEGDEGSLRNVLFEVYYYFYNGLSFPFNAEIYQKTNQLYNNVVASFNLSIPPTQKIKLEIFLAIQWLRIKNHRVLKKSFIHVPVGELEKLRGIRQNLEGDKGFFKEFVDNECAYLFLFLSTQQMIELPLKLNDEETNLKITNITENLIIDVKNKLQLKEQITELEKQEAYEHLVKRLNQIHTSFFIFPFTATTFISENQIQFFEETHPVFHQIIKAFINHLVEEQILTMGENEQIKLYYDYMFAMIMHFPNTYIEDDFYICVDFSHGVTYSDYIAETIRSFKNMNIVVERKIYPHTALYVSDFSITKLNCPQIIWENPPTANDWEQFGDKVIAIKGEKR